MTYITKAEVNVKYTSAFVSKSLVNVPLPSDYITKSSVNAAHAPDFVPLTEVNVTEALVFVPLTEVFVTLLEKYYTQADDCNTDTKASNTAVNALIPPAGYPATQPIEFPIADCSNLINIYNYSCYISL